MRDSNINMVQTIRFKAVPYDKVPFGTPFRYQNKWWNISQNSLRNAYYMSGQGFKVQQNFHHNPTVGLMIKRKRRSN